MENVERRQLRFTSLTRAATAVALVILILSVAHAFTLRFLHERRDGLRTGSIDGVGKQVALVKEVVPAGSVLLYIDPSDEAWQFGLWQRLLYPRNVVVHATSASEGGRVRDRYRKSRPIRFAIVTQSSAGHIPNLRNLVPLPDYFGGIPISLGTFTDADAAQ